MLVRASLLTGSVVFVGVLVACGSGASNPGSADTDGGEAVGGDAGTIEGDAGGTTDGASTKDGGPTAKDSGASDSGRPDGGTDGGTIVLQEQSSFATSGVISCAIVNAGRVKCFGSGGLAGFGYGDTQSRGDGPGEMGSALPYIDLGTGRTAKALALGSFHACAILDDDRIKCWGQNDSGELGLGDRERRGDRSNQSEMGDNLPAVSIGTGLVPLAIAAGGEHTCVIVTGGRVKCWGGNDYGELATGDTLPRGTSPTHMGDALPFIDLGTGAVARALSVGWYHACALLDTGAVKCWGRNSGINGGGQLGLGDTSPRTRPDQMGDALPAVALGVGRTAKQIAVSDTHSCALLDDSTVKCWGDNAWGAFGSGGSLDRGDKPNTMGDALPRFALGTGRTAKAVTTGQSFTCVLLDNGAVKCAGHNSEGRLGLEDQVDRGENSNTIGDNLPTVKLGTGRTATRLWTGYRTTCALLDDATMKCWGGGPLGTGDTLPRGDKAGTMGDALLPLQLQ